MRILAAAIVLAASAGVAMAEVDAVAQCKDFFAKFQTCVDAQEGEMKEEATIFMKTLRGMLGMSDDLNQGDPAMIGIMCGVAIEEAKKDASFQKFKCQW